MCITIPKQITGIEMGLIFVKAKKGKMEAARSIVKNLKKGDWVLTQNDTIIKKISAKQAKEINKIILAS